MDIQISLNDPGLQPQRTALAWKRTCLAQVLLSAVLLRMAFGHGHWTLICVALATMVLSGAAALIALRRTKAILQDVQRFDDRLMRWESATLLSMSLAAIASFWMM